MRVLVACEFSGIVRDAFIARGHNAVSVDLVPSESDKGRHYRGDVFSFLKHNYIRRQFWGFPKSFMPDLMIAFPPCDYLTVSGNTWFRDEAKASPGILTGLARRNARDEAVEFVKRLWAAEVPRIAIENPIGRLSTLWRKPTQVIQPFQFGDPFKKGTCLWLKNLPKLIPTSSLSNGEQACWKMPPSETRKRDRSRTYQGIANAMAEQWGGDK